MTAPRRTWDGRSTSERRSAARRMPGRRPRCARTGQVLALEQALPALSLPRRTRGRARHGHVIRLRDAGARVDWVAFAWMSLVLAGCVWLVADPGKAVAPHSEAVARISHVTALAGAHVLAHPTRFAGAPSVPDILWWTAFGALTLLALSGIVLVQDD